MKLTFNTKEFRRTLEKFYHIFDRKALIPALSYIQFEAGKDELKLTATNLENTLIITQKQTIQDSGTTLIHGKKLHELISKLGDEDCLLTEEDNGCRLKLKRSNWHLQGQPADSFPTIKPVNTEQTFDISSSDLFEGLSRAMVCVDKDNSKALENCTNGIHITIEDSYLLIITMDNYRLFKFKSFVDTSLELKLNLSTRTVRALLAILSDMKGEIIRIGVDQDKFVLQAEGLLFTANTYTGKYPTVHRIFTDYLDQIGVDPSILIKSLARLKLLAEQTISMANFSIRGDCEDLVITFSVKDNGTAEERVPIIGRYRPEFNIDVGINLNILTQDLAKEHGMMLIGFQYKKPEYAAAVTADSLVPLDNLRYISFVPMLDQNDYSYSWHVGPGRA